MFIMKPEVRSDQGQGQNSKVKNLRETNLRHIAACGIQLLYSDHTSIRLPLVHEICRFYQES